MRVVVVVNNSRQQVKDQPTTTETITRETITHSNKTTLGPAMDVNLIIGIAIVNDADVIVVIVIVNDVNGIYCYCPC